MTYFHLLPFLINEKYEEGMCVCICVCVCVFCPTYSIACLNYEVVGFQPQVAANTFLGSLHSPSYIFKPPNAKVCMPETNELKTDNG